jgi:hypothetical protein
MFKKKKTLNLPVHIFFYYKYINYYTVLNTNMILLLQKCINIIVSRRGSGGLWGSWPFPRKTSILSPSWLFKI